MKGSNAPKPKGLPKGTAASMKVDATVKKKEPTKCMNWAAPENKRTLDVAVDEWLNKKGRYKDDGNGDPHSLYAFSNVVGIPYNTLKQYVCKDKSKRRQVGKSMQWAHASSGWFSAEICSGYHDSI